MKSLVTIIRNEKRYAWVFLAIILASYATPLVQELDDIEPYADYEGLLLYYIYCNPFDTTDILHRTSLKFRLNCFSWQVLENDRVMPFVFSIGFVYLVYLLGHYITNDRIIGLIGSLAFSINPLFTTYDTSPTYDQTWAFFLILAVILLYKKSIIASPLVYPIAFLFKILAIAYLPVFLYNIISEPIKHKKLVFGMIISLISVGAIVVVIQDFTTYAHIGFYPERFVEGSLQLLIHLMVILPVLGLATFLVIVKAKTKITGTRIVCIWMFWILLTIPLLNLFMEHFWQFSYRYVPFAAFMSVFIGMAIVNFGNKVIELKAKDLIAKKV